MSFSRYGQGKVRNAALRDALKAQWPEHRFSVRNGRGTWSSVTWIDGPPEGEVERVLNAVLAPDGYPWGASTSRQFSDELLAVAAWRARRAGNLDFYRERDPATGRTLPDGAIPLLPSEVRSRRCVEQHVDAATVTSAERTAASVILAVTGSLQQLGPSRRATKLARTVALHGFAIDAILT